MQSKAEKIRLLYAEGLTTREIADRVGCLTSYVRVVARQRGKRGWSIHDANYLIRRFKASDLSEARRRNHQKRQRDRLEFAK